MGGVVTGLVGGGGGLFGGGGSSVRADPGSTIKHYPYAQDAIFGNTSYSTPYSSLDPNTGLISIDPTGRNLNLSGLNTYAQNLGQTRESLLGNQGAFMQARVNPMLEQLAAGRGLLSRDLNRTGVRGTFRNQAMQNYDINAERAVADQRALATNETLNALNILDQNLFNAQTGVGTNIQNQEMAALGLSAETINSLKAIAANLTTGGASAGASASAAAAQADQAKQDNIMGTIGALGTAAAMFFSDRRLKKNIEKIGMVNGINIYSFDYVWGKPSIGVMADEVMHTGAVHEHESGYLMVDYGRLF